jgi:hypothetical protein
MSKSQRPNRFRPRFSIRTLVIVVTLVCCYAACWGPTKRRGPNAIRQHVGVDEWIEPEPVAPLVVRTTELRSAWLEPTLPDKPTYTSTQRYYLWLFGAVAQLPVAGEVELEYDMYQWTWETVPSSPALASPSAADPAPDAER